MKLEFLHDLSEAGRYEEINTDELVRLFDFGKVEAAKLSSLILTVVIEQGNLLDLGALDFIDTINCNLTLRISDEVIGIVTEDYINFYCDLPKIEYQNMLVLINPFTQKNSRGYQWLYDIDNPIDFLFAPGGSW